MSVAPNLTVKTSIITPKNTSTCTDAIGNIVTYSYDKAGNNLNNSAAYHTKNNQMSENLFYKITYDNMGNIKTKYNKLSKETSTYTFNSRNQLIKYKKVDENKSSLKTLDYSYDAFNRRISKTEDGNLTQYLYDGDDIIAILDKQNQVIATITHNESIDTPLSITNVNGTFYYHRDHQGSIIALTDSSGAVVESFTYDNHYGSIVNHTVTTQTDNPYGYTGRELDTEELYYYRARYYDPTLQRFLGEDPIKFNGQDFNFYRYVWNSPIKWSDPWGLKGFGNFDPKYDLRFCPIAAAMATDMDACRDIVWESLRNGTLGEICTSGSTSVCQIACTASDYYENLKKYCKPRLKKPKAKKCKK